MDAPIRCETHAIATLFSDHFRFTIPYFQRGYGWHEGHAQRLLTNLLEHAAGERDLSWYPLGSIIIAWPGAGHDAEVADGHQRLVTLTLVIAVLRDLEVDPIRRGRLGKAILAANGSPRLTTQAWGQALLADCVQSDGATLRPPPENADDLSPSAEAILGNRDVIRSMLARLAPEQRGKLADFILDRTFIVVQAVMEEKAAELLYQTTNEAGLRTDHVDLLKSRVLGQCPTDGREIARDIWEGVEVRVGREQLDSLLQHLSLLKTRGRAKRSKQAGAYEGIETEAPEGAMSFVLDELKPHGNNLAIMLKAGSDAAARPGPVTRRLQYLNWVLRHDTWRLPALRWLRQYPLDHPDTLAFFRRLEALAWVHMISATEIPQRDARYLAIVEEIDKERALRVGGLLTVKPDECAAARRVLAEGNIVKRHYKLFLLLRLNGVYEGSDIVQVAPAATVEHILPQKPPRGSAWRTMFTGRVPEQKHLHALGNLTLLTDVEQNRAANLEFPVKRGVYRDSPFLLSRRVGEQDNWSIQAIEARTHRLIDDFFADLGIA